MTNLDVRPPTATSSGFALEHRFADEFPELCLEWSAAHVPAPNLVVLNSGLGESLGLDPAWLASDDGVATLVGNVAPTGATPVALAYAGHQFGTYSPRLGDGRALLLGEIVSMGGALTDLHLKGSGRTPFARGGDGKATIGPMLREFVVSEALHTMGVPTTRSLSVVTTGETILRDGPEPGAVLARSASSHIRVGTFEYAVRLGGAELVTRLADHVIERHHPIAYESEHPYRALLELVVDAQARLIAKWMTLGFIHGVMNTDNMTISGEGIDYGPCAFMDEYDPATVFSSIDHGGRYAYGNQVRVAAWNLARFAETLIELLDDDVESAIDFATATVNGFSDRFAYHWNLEMSMKLGFGRPRPDAVSEDMSKRQQALFENLISVMAAEHLDWTLTFRELAGELRSEASQSTEATQSLEGTHRSETTQLSDGRSPERGPRSDRYREWVASWRAMLSEVGRQPEAAGREMDAVNPLYIPRNHVLGDALDSATEGDLGPVEELISVLADPFTQQPGLETYAAPAPPEFTSGFRTFCGT